MSSSLVRKGLELFSDDTVLDCSGESTGSKKTKKKGGPSSMRREDLMKCISTNKKGVKKQLKRLTHKQIQGPTAKAGKMKSSIDAFLKSKPADSTETNIQLLLSLSKGHSSTSKSYAKIMEHSRRKSGRQNQTEESTKESGFTEEDFALFEKEYVPKKSNSIL
ncbi:active regulator of SIRT1-like [Diadema setosum]|uniref:active regulator of SIRT1-like n=1 Tax=Diadema setosum TaxID=31175 RepID=UPI003B3AC5EE